MQCSLTSHEALMKQTVACIFIVYLLMYLDAINYDNDIDINDVMKTTF